MKKVKNILPAMEDLVKMKAADVKKIVQKAVKRARQLSERLLKSDVPVSSTPAISAARESKPTNQSSLFEIKGKDRNALIQEYKRAKAFIEADTSTITGAKTWYQKTKDALAREAGIELPEDRYQQNKIFDLLKDYDKNHKGADRNFRYFLMEKANEMLTERPRMSANELVNILTEDEKEDDQGFTAYDRTYQQYQREKENEDFSFDYIR